MTRIEPLIGITTYAANENHEVTLPVNYIESVRRAGGIPVLLPPGEQQIESLLPHLSGLILAGGGDIAPECYGGESHPLVYMVDEGRDRMELSLAREVIQREIPTLAICRGLQITNVALGGTLYPHLPDHFGDSIDHRKPPREPTPHRIEVDQDSRLAAIMESDNVETMSWHHQALNQVADELHIVARAADGVIEAVELTGHPWFIGVQWHPELTSDQDPTQQNLFNEIVRQSRSTAIQ